MPRIVRPIFKVFNTAGGWRWSLVASNGKAYATCVRSYRRKRDCLTAITAIQNMAALCEVTV